jgi:hypothetical protein
MDLYLTWWEKLKSTDKDAPGYRYMVAENRFQTCSMRPGDRLVMEFWKRFMRRDLIPYENRRKDPVRSDVEPRYEFFSYELYRVVGSRMQSTLGGLEGENLYELEPGETLPTNEILRVYLSTYWLPRVRYDPSVMLGRVSDYMRSFAFQMDIIPWSLVLPHVNRLNEEYDTDDFTFDPRIGNRREFEVEEKYSSQHSKPLSSSLGPKMTLTNNIIPSEGASGEEQTSVGNTSNVCSLEEASKTHSEAMLNHDTTQTALSTSSSVSHASGKTDQSSNEDEDTSSEDDNSSSSTTSATSAQIFDDDVFEENDVEEVMDLACIEDRRRAIKSLRGHDGFSESAAAQIKDQELERMLMEEEFDDKYLDEADIQRVINETGCRRLTAVYHLNNQSHVDYRAIARIRSIQQTLGTDSP